MVSNKHYGRNTFLAKVHVAKAQLKLSDGDYLAILSNWKNPFGGTIESSADMDADQLIALLDLFRDKLGWEPKPRKKDKKFIRAAVEGERPNRFATTAQLEKINLLWVKHSRQGDAESLRKFVSRILHVDLVESIQSNQVAKLIKAIENLK